MSRATHDVYGRPYIRNHKCRLCTKAYVDGDTLDRHMREKHGDRYQQEEAKIRNARMRETAKREQRAYRHKTLVHAVVKEALAMWRWKMEWSKPDRARGGVSTLKLFDARPFAKACAALEKFETGVVRP